MQQTPTRQGFFTPAPTPFSVLVDAPFQYFPPSLFPFSAEYCLQEGYLSDAQWAQIPILVTNCGGDQPGTYGYMATGNTRQTRQGDKLQESGQNQFYEF